MEYYWLLVILVLFSFLDYSNKYNFIFKLIVFLCLVLLAGSRLETGNDWGNYLYFFEHLDIGENFYSLSLISKFEPGYTFLNLVVKYIGGSLNEVFLFASFITIGIISISIRKYTQFWFIPILLYLRYSYLQANMMFVRQGIAVAIFVYALQFIQKREKWKYFSLILIASLFHISALMLLPLYYLYGFKFNARKYIILLIVSIISIQLNLINLIVHLIPFEFIKGPVLGYLQSEVWSRPSTVSFSTIERLFIVILGIIYFNKLNAIHKYFALFYNIYFFGVLLYFIFFNSYVFAERVSIYFNVLAMFLLVYYFELFKVKKQKIIYHILLISFVSLFFLKTIYSNDQGNVYLPYNSYLYEVFE